MYPRQRNPSCFNSNRKSAPSNAAATRESFIGSICGMGTVHFTDCTSMGQIGRTGGKEEGPAEWSDPTAQVPKQSILAAGIDLRLLNHLSRILVLAERHEPILPRNQA